MLVLAVLVRADSPVVPEPVLGGKAREGKDAGAKAVELKPAFPVAPVVSSNAPAVPAPVLGGGPAKAGPKKAKKNKAGEASPADASTNAPPAAESAAPKAGETNAPVASADAVPAPKADAPKTADTPPATTNAPAVVTTEPAPVAEPVLMRDVQPAAEAAPAAPGAAEVLSGQLSLSGRYAFPSDDMWKSGFGVELQWRRWYDGGFGWGVAAGYESWDIESGELALHDDSAIPLDISGDATIVPIGASALYRQTAGSVDWILEAGLRYLFVDSGVRVHRAYTDHLGRWVEIDDTVPLDNRVAAVLALEVQGPIDDLTGWFLGAGYRIDFTSGENWLYEEIANDLGGAWIGAGVRRKL